MKNTPIEKEKKKITDSNVLWMLVSILAAVIFWMYVSSTEGVEVTRSITNVPVIFRGEDSLRVSRDLIVTEQDQTSVDLTLSGKRRVLSQLNNDNVTAVIDLLKLTSDGQYTVAYELSYPGGVTGSDVSVVDRSVDVINFYLDKLSRKTVEVRGDFTGTTAEGYLAEESLAFDPLVVNLSGPKKSISRVDCAYVSITRENVDRTLQYSTTFDLLDADGEVVDDSQIERDIDEVRVTLNILSTKQVPLDVTILDGGGATRADNTNIVIEPASILLAGDASVIDSTTKLNLGTIDLSLFATDYSATYNIVIPAETENLTGVNEASVTVSITGLATKTFSIPQDNLSCINVPEEYTAAIITQSLNVTVRAPQEILNQIEEENLRAVADLSDAAALSPGVFNPTTRIYIDGFTEAGVVGDYRIYIMLNPVL